MTDTLTLAHLSDVHLSSVRGVALRQLNVKRGLGYLNWQRKRKFVHRTASLDLVVQDLKAQRPDHIAITGDLINLGLPGEYEAARAWLDDIGPPQVVTVVPGNHDIYTKLRNHPGVELWSEYMQPDAWGAKLLSGSVTLPSSEGFPFVRRVGRIALIGLNSAVKTPPFVASGWVGEAQMAMLPDLLERTHHEGLVRVVLIHHPPLPGLAPARRALRDAADLERVLAAHGAELVLHGHNHRDNHVDLAWAKGRIPVIGVASGSGARAYKDEPLGRYNLLHITPTESGAQIECITRGLDASGSRVEQVDRKRLDAATPAP